MIKDAKTLGNTNEEILNAIQALHSRGALEGAWENLPDEIYFSNNCPGESNSMLGLLMEGASLYIEKKHGKALNEPTPEMIFGSAVHEAILRPDIFQKKFCPVPPIDKRTKEGKEMLQVILQNFPGATHLSAERYEEVLAMRDRVLRNPVLKKVFAEGKPEVTLFWTEKETGILCKGRADWLREDGIILDLKTTTDARKFPFSKTIAERDYDRQAAFYLDGAAQVFGRPFETFVFIPVEKKRPYKMNLFPLGADSVEVGRQLYKKALQRLVFIQQFQKTNAGLPEEECNGFEVIETPIWAHNLEARL